MASYEAVIGLEVHVRLATKSKLFCSCPNRFGDEPNANVCEICAGMPGVLPVPNAQAVHYATLVGLATNCTIRQRSLFARKNYFYPDLPAGYQISQFELPLCEHGHLDLLVNGQTRRIGITRIHMENDAGKNIHSKEDNVSYVDLNRAGSPLVEIVSEPDLRSAAEAVAYLKTLYGIVVYLGVCDGNMEEGSFRCDVNVSMRPVGTQKLGVRAELKNLNSFRNVQRAIEYELVRQQDLLEDGEAVVQETRLFDADKNLTVSMREKEEAHDYRYFPDPDLLPITISDADLEQWQKELPELPNQRMQRFIEMTALPEAEAEILVQTKALADFFETAASKANPRKIANLILGPVLRECKAQNFSATDPTQWAITPNTLVELVQIVEEGLISTKIADDIFSTIFAGGKSPRQYVQEQGLVQISDSSSLEAVVDEVLAKNPNEVQAYKSGKTKLISFFVGQVMRATKGKANPALVNKLLNAKLV